MSIEKRAAERVKLRSEIERLRALLDKGLFLSVDETISPERRIREAAAWVKEVRATLSQSAPGECDVSD